MSQENKIGEEDFNIDDLLKQSLLNLDENDPKNNDLFNKLAGDVFNKDWPLPEQTKEKLKTEGFVAKKFQLKWLWYLSVFAGLSLITYFVFSYNKSEENKLYNGKNNSTKNVNEQLNVIPVSIEDTVNNAILKKTDATKENESNYVPAQLEKDSLLPITKQEEHKPVEELKPDEMKDASALKETTAEIKKEQTFLSEEQLKQHQLLKTELNKNWASLRFKDYSAIVIKANTSAKIKSGTFYLKRAEVSNRDYNLFLNDLLLKGRQDEYNKAKPKFEEWIEKVSDAAAKEFIYTYFTSKKYEHFPVVCISAEACQMYCTWLQNEILEQNKQSRVNIVVRLPDEEEWKIAASGGNESHKYATDDGHLSSLKDGFKANFREAQINADWLNTTASTENATDVKKKFDWLHMKPNATFDKFTTTAMAYMMNKFGLYNMSGNVSELVWTRSSGNTKTLRTIGGNWYSDKKFLQINAEDEFGGNTSPSQYWGFRPLIYVKENSRP